MEILEGAASRLGGFALASYRRRFPNHFKLSVSEALAGSEIVLRELARSSIPPSLALSALARPRLTHVKQRWSGAYYTDFRLAQYVAHAARTHLVPGAQVIDPAAGTGILLVAASLAACGPDRLCIARWLAESITAADLSLAALRGARLALASLTDDLLAVATMDERWRHQDSLTAAGFKNNAFDVVLGNPPWEKIKLTRHEFLHANGTSRHYGADYSPLNNQLFSAQRSHVANYAFLLSKHYRLLGSGDPDLYKAFLELFIRLVRAGGCVSVLVPAGLIRSQGTEALRRFLFSHTDALSITVIENRARFFAIDTRFKFLALTMTTAIDTNGQRRDLQVVHASGTGPGLRETGRAHITRRTLEALRPDLTIPEVRSESEWRLFRAMSDGARPRPSTAAAWHSEIVREVDMTRDRKAFSRAAGRGRVPLIEGRMIHQHRFAAKAYRNGTGRRARWETIPLGARELIPQFWYPAGALPSSVRARMTVHRAGFCDITGQTNERSMLAALVPPDVVCGNKVPTVTFPNDPRIERLFLWLAVVNSIPFDWALRRLVTTTVNYFVLQNVPFPNIEPDSLRGRRLVEATHELHRMDCGHVEPDAWRAGRLRAAIDVAVHVAYGLDFDDLVLMLKDFPLLDRGQPPLIGEAQSTCTRDLLLSQAAKHFRRSASPHAERVREAATRGAVPYLPAEFSLADMPEVEGAYDG
jgi:hypothetical protein